MVIHAQLFIPLLAGCYSLGSDIHVYTILYTCYAFPAYVQQVPLNFWVPVTVSWGKCNRWPSGRSQWTGKMVIE